MIGGDEGAPSQYPRSYRRIDIFLKRQLGWYRTHQLCDKAAAAGIAVARISGGEKFRNAEHGSLEHGPGFLDHGRG